MERDTALATLRRNLWLAGNSVRDFFINTNAEQAEALRSQIGVLKRENDKALNFLANAFKGTSMAPELRRRLDEFWAVVQPLPTTMLQASKDRQFEFLQREIVPRRGELYSALVALTAADQQKLQESEREFSGIRRRGALRLILMLGLSVLLSLAGGAFQPAPRRKPGAAG